MAPQIKWLDEDIFATPPPAAAGARRGKRAAARAAAEPATEAPAFLRQVPDVLQPVAVRSAPVRDEAFRAAARPEVAVRVEAEPGEEYLLIVRHPSGALSFHAGTDVTPPARRGTKAKAKAKAKSVIEFRAPLAHTAHLDVRRGLFGDLLQGVVDRIVVKVGTVIAETAVDLAEAAIWRVLGRERGLHRVTQQGLRDGRLEPVDRLVARNGRALLFLHGTFSTTQSAFGELANSAFFDSLRERYGDAIYGFDHFTVSVTPEQNANDLLAALPPGTTTIDVVTHSRGGLVLRNLVERRARLTGGTRFALGHAVLVASPNEGTLLASARKWDRTVGWLANVLDLFPPNPLTSNASMVAHWIAWFAKTTLEAAEGLKAMDPNGEQVQELQQPPKPSPDHYSALVSNFEPDKNLLARAFDLSLDGFFETANDLVVPTAGGWRIDKLFDAVPPERVGCFGPGGNILASGGGPIHTAFFSQQQTVDFLVKALLRQPQGLPQIELARELPNKPLRSVVLSAAAAAPARVRSVPRPIQPADREPQRVRPPTTRVATGAARPGALELTVISSEEGAAYAEDDAPLLLASYDGARVRVPFRTSKRHIAKRTEDWVLDEYQVKELTSRWGLLFATHRKIKRFVDSRDGTPPPEADLLRFGELLFETLLPGDAKRLFDVARSREKEKLLIIFTSTIPWVFDMPWEFARDPTRGTFLATEDALFVRNIFTTTPVDRLDRKPAPLRLLIATSEPAGLELFAARQEAEDIRSGLADLVQRGLFEIEVRENLTAERLHREASTGNYDIVHFIGHGFWDAESGKSGLVLEDGNRGPFHLGDRSLREILSGRKIRVVFLNACDTARSVSPGARPSAIAGTAQDLFSRGVPNVVANQLKVGDKAAATFAKAFYDFLAHGKTIAEATREARIASSYRPGMQSIDWAVPVVYARDADDALVEVRN